MEAPPIGLLPQFLHDEHREVQILAAIRRYSEAGLSAPTEWIDELEQISTRRRNRKINQPESITCQRFNC